MEQTKICTDQFLDELRELITNWNKTIRLAQQIVQENDSMQTTINRIEDKLDLIHQSIIQRYHEPINNP